MRAIDMHVHLPTGDWVCGCVGHYADSIERYFGKRPEATSLEEFVALYERLDMVGVLLGWDAGGKTLDNARDRADLFRVRAVRRVRQRGPEPRGRAGAAGARSRRWACAG